MIIFTKDLLPLNPAYNDSIIQFSSSTISDTTKAVLTIDGKEFIIAPFGTQFTFNLKEIVKTLINSDRFEDSIVPDFIGTGWVQSDNSISAIITIDIKIYNMTGDFDTIVKSYNFYRGVEQLPEYHRLSQIQSGVRVLLPTSNYIDYNVKMFEGYPFDFAIYGIDENDSYYLKNKTTNQETELATSIDNQPKRFYLSDGGNNSTDTDILINSSTLNRTELWVNNSFKANININKIESRCGVYLKWLNSNGSYSYWLFEPFYKSMITAKTIDTFQGQFDNLQNLSSTSHLTW